MLELALILLPMLTLLVGIVEIAWFYHHQYAIFSAASTAARAAAAEGDSAALNVVATDAASGVLNQYGISDAEITATLVTGPPDVVSVSVVVPFGSIAGLVPMPLSVSGVATAMYEDVDN